MIRRIMSAALALAVLVSVTLAFGGVLSIAVPSFEEIAICTQEANQGGPDVSGDLVVWQDYRNGNWDIYGYDLATGKESAICTASATQWRPSVSGDLVVWEDARNGNPDIYGYDLATGKEVAICTQGDDQLHPAVSGDLVVWADERNGNWDIYGYDVGAGQESTICTDSVTQREPAVSGDVVVWTDLRNGGTNADIYGYDLGTELEIAICTQGDNQYSPTISGDLVVWEDTRNPSYDIYGYDLGTEQESAIATQSATQDNPTVSGDLVVWYDNRNGIVDIFGYDVGAGEAFDICTQGGAQEVPVVSGDVIAWRDSRSASDDIYGADIALDPTRAFGATRFETAVAVSQAHPEFSSAVAILATGRDFPDALSAAGLAGAYHAPLLLTQLDSIPAAVTTELTRLKPRKIILIGGTGAISAGVEATLKDSGYDVSRIGGANRYETSQLIAKEIATLMGSQFEGRAFVARGDAFPDALSASPIAYNRKTPILLTRPGSLAPETAEALLDLDIEGAVIVGGTGAVDESVKATIDARLGANGGVPSLRWSGANRYETSVVIAEEAKGLGLAGVGFVGLATGLNFPDALAGGVACGQEYGVLLLTPPSALPTVTSDFFAAYKDGIGAMEAYGGTAVLPDAVVNAARNTIN